MTLCPQCLHKGRSYNTVTVRVWRAERDCFDVTRELSFFLSSQRLLQIDISIYEVTIGITFENPPKCFDK